MLKINLLLVTLILLLTSCSKSKDTPITDPGVFKVSSIEINSPDQEFEPLGDIVGDAQIVGLGESVHTVGGYYQAKFRMFKWLVENKGFRAFAWESSWHEAKLAEDYIANCDGDAEPIMWEGLFEVWGSQETYDLLNWMCQWNNENPNDPVIFYGWDSQNPWRDGSVIRDIVPAYNPNSSQLILDMEQCDGALASDVMDYYTNFSSEGLIPDQQHNSCLLALDNLDIWQTQYSHLLTTEQRFDLEVALISLRSWQLKTYYSGINNHVEKYEVRDLANAKIIDLYRDNKYPGIKTVIWAANSHIAYENHNIYGLGDDSFAVSPYQGWRSTGTELRLKHGSDYKAIGLFGYEVTINWGPRNRTYIPTNDMNVEKMIYDELGYDYAIIDFSKIEMLDANVRYQMDFQWLRPHDHFEGVFYLEYAWARSTEIIND